MNKKQQKEFNLRCARLLYPNALDYKFNQINNGIEVLGIDCIGVTTLAMIDAYNNANDRNKVIEKMRISTMNYRNTEWECASEPRPDQIETIEYAYKLDDAQIACIASVLEINNE